MKEIGIGILIVALLAGLGWAVAIYNRPLAKFTEETRRQVYEESVTAHTACRANISRLYNAWATAGDAHKIAIEAQARDESLRSRCQNLDPAVNQWLGSISR